MRCPKEGLTSSRDGPRGSLMRCPKEGLIEIARGGDLIELRCPKEGLTSSRDGPRGS